MSNMRVISQVIEVDVFGVFEELEDYDALLTLLHEADYHDKINILLNSPGGNCDVGQMLIRAVQKSRAHIAVDVVYPSASMASMLAMAGDSLIIRPGAFLMFHNYSGGNQGKGDEMLQSLHATAKALKVYAEICFPFLTRAEMNAIESDKDFYIHFDDDNLQTRVNRHFKIPKAKRGLGI